MIPRNLGACGLAIVAVAAGVLFSIHLAQLLNLGFYDDPRPAQLCSVYGALVWALYGLGSRHLVPFVAGSTLAMVVVVVGTTVMSPPQAFTRVFFAGLLAAVVWSRFPRGG